MWHQRPKNRVRPAQNISGNSNWGTYRTKKGFLALGRRYKLKGGVILGGRMRVERMYVLLDDGADVLMHRLRGICGRH
jgi:hypothetical protein